MARKVEKIASGYDSQGAHQNERERERERVFDPRSRIEDVWESVSSPERPPTSRKMRSKGAELSFIRPYVSYASILQALNGE
jgi:hypothetical protein